MGWFKKRKSLVAKLDDFDNGFDEGWEACRTEILQFLRDEGQTGVAIDVEAQF